MPSLITSQPPHYTPAPPTKEALDYADLAIIDLSKAATPEGRAELAQELKAAFLTHGFFFVINHGYTQAQTERIFDIADVPISHVPEEEKITYAGNSKVTGRFQGYKPRQYWHVDAGVRDQQEHYNVNRDISKVPHPLALRPFLPELDSFIRHNHFNILHPILILIALSLELPEETLVNVHNFDEPGGTYTRFMKYFPRSEEDEVRTKNVWMKGHKDFGSVTLLWSQPVAALQIQTKEGWKWVRHVDNALIVNAGESLEFLSGGFYKGTIHRVVQPPQDQRGYTRLGIIYFGFVDDSIKLVPLAQSPVLQRVGIQRRCEDSKAPTGEEWRVARVSAYGASQLKQGKEEGIEEEVLTGIVIQHYN
ncbi:Clavaminate synthase-like protein [Hygrophoropsis aurantiaca]|uniref:Clavaminate synthase-like protein n=1 Tax=Hygrophoropsis aurantiaca TaxID=72124 RepID=A0ACB8ARM1_9AGAM|nr:Clavaminate synthase-like protein [Hygrophoropsis aurantiaca]